MVGTPGEAAINLNEFVLALVSVIIGLGVSDLLISFHKLLRAGARVKWHWLPVSYAVLMLYSLIVFWWWQFGDPPAGQALTIAQFIPHFIFLALTFLMVAAALPDHVPVEGIDLRRFYDESLRHRWGLVVIAMTLELAILAFTFARRGEWNAIEWNSLALVSAVLAALSIRITATWFQALTIGWIFAVTSFFNLFHSIGP